MIIRCSECYATKEMGCNCPTNNDPVYLADIINIIVEKKNERKELFDTIPEGRDKKLVGAIEEFQSAQDQACIDALKAMIDMGHDKI
jgi:hypothetical protein